MQSLSVRIRNAFQRRNEAEFVSIIRSEDTLNPFRDEHSLAIFCQKLDDAYEPLMTEFLFAKLCFREGRFEDAFQRQKKVFIHLKGIKDAIKDANFLGRILQIYVLRLRLYAKYADDDCEQNKIQKHFMEDAASALQHQYAESARLFPDHVLYLANCQISIFFALDKMEMCDQIFLNIRNNTFKDRLDTLPHSQLAVLRFYMGSRYVLSLRLKDAEENLSLAFKQIPLKFRTQRRVILKSLVPLWIVRQVYPSREFLRRYNLEYYSEVIASVKSGNLSRLNTALEELQDTLVNTNTLLVLQMAKQTAILNLMKRSYQIMKSIPGYLEKSWYFPLAKFLPILQMHDPEVDMNELMCIVANLVEDKYVKGFIHFDSSRVILAQDNPFPIQSAQI